MRRAADLLGNRWTGAALLALVLLPSIVDRAITSPLQRFDEGILVNTTSFLAQGILPPGDAYGPYGPGYGLPALPLHLLVGPEWVLTTASTLLCLVLLPALAYAWLRPRIGIPLALGAALVVSLVDTSRYALSWLAVLGMAIGVDAVVRRGGGTLEQGAQRHPRAMAAATGILGLAVWVRLEYLSLVVAWIVVVWVGLGRRRRPPLVLVLPPLVVALVAHVAVLVAGGPRHYWWWGHYAVFGFRDFRAQPRNWDLPVDYVRALFGGAGDLDDLRLQVISYLAGTIMVLAAVVLLVLRRGVRRDPALLAPFLVAAGAIILYAQSVRYHGHNGIQAVGILLPGFLALGFTARWVRPLAVVALVLVGLAPILDRLDAPARIDAAREGWRANGAHEPVDRLRRATLTGEERQSLAVLPSLWRRSAPDPGRVAVVSRSNDDAQANEAMLYWYLGARPAVWPVTYDPGLADATPVVSEVLRDLCARRPGVVQFRAAYAVPFGRHGDRRLDPFLALNYRLAGDGDLYRVLVPRGGPCLRPGAVPVAQLHARRDAALLQDDLPAAAALASAAVARPGRAAPADALLIILQGHRIEDPADVPDGRLGAVVRAAEDGQPAAGLPAVIADTRQPDLVRLEAMLAFVGQSGAFSDDVKRQVLAAAYDLLRRHPGWPQLGEVVRAFQPPAEVVFARIADLGVRATWFLQWRFEARAQAGDPRAVADGRALLRRYGAVYPLQRGAVLQTLSPVFSALGDARCAQAALARADRIPGIDPGPYEHAPTACARL